MSRRAWTLLLAATLIMTIATTVLAITEPNIFRILSLIPWTAAATTSFLALTRDDRI